MDLQYHLTYEMYTNPNLASTRWLQEEEEGLIRDENVSVSFDLEDRFVELCIVVGFVGLFWYVCLSYIVFLFGCFVFLFHFLLCAWKMICTTPHKNVPLSHIRFLL